MGELTSQERACVEAASAAPMLAQVENWSEINSGSRNLEGLATLGARLAGAFAALPGEIQMIDPAPVEAIDPAGKPYEVPHGRNLHLKVRPDAPVQLLFTGHMDTVFAADHAFHR
jgi:glutamate carboxypeptidase